jgi:hypothetical protein
MLQGLVGISATFSRFQGLEEKENKMPLPSRDQTFAFANCRELLEKLDREIDRYRDVAGRDEAEPEALFNLVNRLKDSAFNAAVTAWHLCDWVFNDMTVEQRQQLKFSRLADLQNYVREKCRSLHLCRQAATASKHWTVNNHPDPEVEIIVTAEERGWTVYFIDGGHKNNGEDVFQIALAFWTNFIWHHGIAKA